MTKAFARKFNLNQLPEPKPIWWQDILKRLKPAGHALGQYGLRLAVRQNYLNFYHRGQSIGKVAFNKYKKLYTEPHIKYVFDDASTQCGVRLTGDKPTLTNPENNDDFVEYLGGATLEKWIDRATNTKVKEGDEKSFVDCVVAANANVIDMEMGLPGSGYRIDLVSLEQQGAQVNAVFWEVKLATDSRCRTNGDQPEVIEQLERYRDFLNNSERQQQLKVAYVNACKVLVEISSLANHPVSQVIEKVATGDLTLTIDPEPRLLICNNERPMKNNRWIRHEHKLIGSTVAGNKLTMQVMTPSGDKVLKTREQLQCHKPL